MSDDSFTREQVKQYLKKEFGETPEDSDLKEKAKQDLLYTIKDLAEEEELEEERVRELGERVRKFLKSLRKRTISWDEADYHDIGDLKVPDMEGKTVKIRVQLQKMSEPVAVHISGLPPSVQEEGNDESASRHLLTHMFFREVDGAEKIDSTPTVNTDLIKKVRKKRKDHHVFDVLGTVALIPSHGGIGSEFKLLVHDMRVSEDSLQMVKATKPEIKEAKSTLKELNEKDKSVYSYIKERLCKGLGIKGLERSPRLSDSLETIIVQAFSDGYVNTASVSKTPSVSRTSGKLHTLIIGAPAVGKKKLTEAAQVLNPVFQEAQPTKATAAGVQSTSRQGEGGVWKSDPGYIPLAHHGVFAIQDFHSVKRARREKLLGIFNMVMEDGKVEDSTAANVEHPTNTSIHLDTNKRTDLFPDSKLQGDTIVAKRLDDIRIPMTSLSRFDFIVDIQRDIDRQKEIAKEMFEVSDEEMDDNGSDKSPNHWARKLKVLVAFLRTKHEEVKFPEETREAMKKEQDDLWESYEKGQDRWPWLSDFLTRLSNSVYKFSAAFARMNDRGESTKEDVDKTFKLIRRKFDFIDSLGEQIRLTETQNTSYEPQAPQGNELDVWLSDTFQGQRVKTKDILEAYEEEFEVELVRRTLNRHLPKVAKKIRQGVYEFPDEEVTSSQ